MLKNIQYLLLEGEQVEVKVEFEIKKVELKGSFL